MHRTSILFSATLAEEPDSPAPLPQSHLWLLALLLVTLSDLLFFRYPLGWTLGGFPLLVGFAVAGRAREGRAGLKGVALAAPLVLACATLVVNSTRIGLALAAAALLLVAAVPRTGWPATLEAWADRAALVLLRAPLRLLEDVIAVIGARDRSSQPWRATSGLLARLLRAWGAPVVLASVFLALLDLANPVLASWMGSAGDVVAEVASIVAAVPEPLRIAFWTASAIAVWGLLRGAEGRVVRWSSHAREALARAPRGELLPRDVLLRALVLLNLVFAVQNGLDVAFLWGGRTLPEGMSYSSYAHRGAYPLVATALLAAALVLVTFRPGGLAARSRLARALVHLWLAQNIVLTASAAWRLESYVEAYGFTRLRAAAALWMLLIAFGLAAILARIALGRSNGWLLRTNLAALLVLLYGVAFVDLDGRIAWYNVHLAAAVQATGETSRLDLAYLEHLGQPALPALAWVAAREPVSARGVEAATRAARLRHSLVADLADWRGWTWRRARIADLALWMRE